MVLVRATTMAAFGQDEWHRLATRDGSFIALPDPL